MSIIKANRRVSVITEQVGNPPIFQAVLCALLTADTPSTSPDTFYIHLQGTQQVTQKHN